MSFVAETLALLERCPAATTLRVRALHLPPRPTPGDLRGEFGAVELADGAVGLSYVLLGDTWAQLVSERARYDPAGRLAIDVARGFASADALERTIALAAVNALTRSLYDRAGFAAGPSADSIGNLDPQPGDSVGMIGYFVPLAPRITSRGARLVVVELREDLAGERDGVRITLDAGELASCNKVLATGTLLLNDTLDRMLGHARHASRFALIGPSVGGPPDPLFARSVTLLGGSWVTDARAFVDALVRGEPTGPASRKFALARDEYPGWDALLARAAAA